MSGYSLSLVVPVYNEAEVVEEAIRFFLSGLSRLAEDFELIIVDDGSTDETGRIIERSAVSDARVKVIHNGKNYGSGWSLWRGMQEAGKDVVLTNFADRPFDLGDGEMVLDLLQTSRADFVVVTRKDRSANSPYRKVTSMVNYFLIRILFGIPIRDFQFVQAYKRDILQGMTLDATGTFVPPELMIRLIDKGHPYRQIACHFHRRSGGEAKCGKLSVISTTIKEMMCFWSKRQGFGNRRACL